jgi:hypothetical protein
MSFDPSLNSMHKFLDLTIAKPRKEVPWMEGMTVLEAVSDSLLFYSVHSPMACDNYPNMHVASEGYLVLSAII